MNLPVILLFLPLAVAVVITLFLRRLPQIAALVATGSAAITLVASVLLLGSDDTRVILWSWLTVPGTGFEANIGIQLSPLSRGMLFIVTLVGTLVHIFSLGYMKDDPGKARYFAALALFMFSMTGIVLADNLVMMFIFWELVGVSSYLLIGHWNHKTSAVEAAKKAFLVNRIGDFGFMIGILLIWGLTGSVSFDGIAAALPGLGEAASGLVTAATLCLFCGAVGKSAQLPLHVWLPDAMEGPTPVSALIHAATMVAAGVFMLVRVDFLIAESAAAATVIAWVGGITALLAALMATQQNDIKRVLAYSTLSQLGYMVMAVGLLASAAAMFHLYTHAFFKALLFLGAGAVIHACHHEQNIWRMGGLLKRMPITGWTFAIGTAALVALPLTSGFWSKEAILEAALAEDLALFILAVLVAVMTAFYMGRLFIVAFLGQPRDVHAKKAGEVEPVMWVPLAILAVFSLLAGFNFIARGLEAQIPDLPHSLLVTLLSIGALAGGLLLGWKLYLGRNEEPLRIRLFENKFYFDEFYQGLVRFFQDGVAWVVNALDRLLIDGLLVRGSAALTAATGGLFRRMVSGNVQAYAFLFGFGLILILYIAVFAR